jgi:hypothetical protein
MRLVTHTLATARVHPAWRCVCGCVLAGHDTRAANLQSMSS